MLALRTDVRKSLAFAPALRRYYRDRRTSDYDIECLIAFNIGTVGAPIRWKMR